MSRDFGPWVRPAWCPTCNRSTEQTRWHSYDAPDSPRNGVKGRCNDCLQPAPSEEVLSLRRYTDPYDFVAAFADLRARAG